MPIYYDTLIPYMPDTTKNDAGEMIPDEVLTAGRSAMIGLAEFQNTGNLMSLYQVVISACKYAGKDLVDSLLTIPDDVTPKNEATIENMLDEAATILFRSINAEKYPFDLNRFLANVLTAEHHVFLAIQQATAVQQDTATDKETTHDN